MDWKDNFKEEEQVILATASKKGIPNANIVISLGFTGGKLLIADCMMQETIKNLQENENVCVIGGYYRVKGKVKLYTSGKFFDLCAEKSKGFTVRHALLITVEEVFDLDSVKEIEI